MKWILFPSVVCLAGAALFLASRSTRPVASLAPTSPANIQIEPGPDETAPPGSSRSQATFAPEEQHTSPAKEVAPDQTPARSASAPLRQHANYVEQRTAELMDLALEDDAASLNIILSELNNRDPAIRKAALEAAIQFGSRDAIPALLDAAAQTEDPKEKQALIEAADFLKLPSLTEVLAARGLKPTVRPIAR